MTLFNETQPHCGCWIKLYLCFLFENMNKKIATRLMFKALKNNNNIIQTTISTLTPYSILGRLYFCSVEKVCHATFMQFAYRCSSLCVQQYNIKFTPSSSHSVLW